MAGIITSILGILGFGERTAIGQEATRKPEKTKRTVSFDEQWSVFQKLGFKLNSGIDDDTIRSLRKEKSIEERPFEILYMVLGTTIEKEPWTPLTDRVWDFDTEAIEDHGAYVEIIRNLERITRGELKFENVEDHVDLEEEKAWVSFMLRGRRYKWNLKVDDDWVDPGLFSKFASITTELKTRGRFTYFDTGGQDFVIGFETPESRDAIVKATGLRIEWLS